MGGGPIIDVTTVGHTHSDSRLKGLVWQGVRLVGNKGSTRRVLGKRGEERERVGWCACRTKQHTTSQMHHINHCMYVLDRPITH